MSKIPKPWKHQLETITLGRESNIIYDVSDPGTGKTRAHLEILKNHGFRKQALVLAPKTLLQSAWGDDIDAYFPGMTYICAYATNREFAFAQSADVIITNIDAVKWLAANPKLLKRFDKCVVDEVTGYKHRTSQRSKAAAKVMPRMEVRAGLTGTPNSLSILDVWHQAFLLDGGARLGNNFFAFRQATCTPVQVGPRPEHLQWKDKPGAETVVFDLLKDILIRHEFEDVMKHVPKNYIRPRVKYKPSSKLMGLYRKFEDEALLVLEDEDVTGVNAAAVRQKLLQIACVGYNTMVLSERGWIPIQSVLRTDRVWDGEEWVNHDGSYLKGTEQVIKCKGVWMTPEHLVLTQDGWQTAEVCSNGKSSARFNRQEVRLPKGFEASRNYKTQMRDMGMPVQLWKQSCAIKPVSQVQESSKRSTLRMPPRGAYKDSWDEQNISILHMERNEVSLLQSSRKQRLQELRRTWNQSLQALGKFFREFLGRYETRIQTRLNTWSYQQQWKLQPVELSLGNYKAAKQQHAQQQIHRDAEGHNDNRTGRRSIWDKASDSLRKINSIQLDTESRFERVYDLANCGPRSRFVVLGDDGRPLIVHNSGAVYSNKDYALLDTGRYELVLDLVEERKHSVVFYLWDHQGDELCRMAKDRGTSFTRLDGDTPDGKRSEIRKAFQDGVFQTIFINYKTGAHGLTLTRARTAILCSPIYEADYLKQIRHRVWRGGQTHTSELIMIEAEGTVEGQVYEHTQGKTDRMMSFLDLIKEARR